MLDVGKRDGNRRGNDLSERNKKGVDSRVKKRTGSVFARSNSKWGKQETNPTHRLQEASRTSVGQSEKEDWHMGHSPSNGGGSKLGDVERGDLNVFQSATAQGLRRV